MEKCSFRGNPVASNWMKLMQASLGICISLKASNHVIRWEDVPESSGTKHGESGRVAPISLISWRRPSLREEPDPAGHVRSSSFTREPRRRFLSEPVLCCALQVRFFSPFNRAVTVRMALPLSAQSPVVELQKVTTSNKHGEKLVGLLHDTGSNDIVILCHGLCSTKEDDVMVNIAKALEKEGISVFRFDFAGNGESEGSFSFGNYWREADDLRAVIEHFRGATPSRGVSAILGHSKGAGVVLLYASKYQDISTVFNVSGRYDLNKGLEERAGKNFMEKIEQDGFIDVKNGEGSVIYRVTKEALMDRRNTDMHEACLAIKKDCRVFTIHGSADEAIPVEDAFEFAKIIPNHNLHIIEGANHCYTSHLAELASAVVNFMKATLQQGKDTA
ncbi:hypothetical protein OIU79_023578 [Salix purpurea]|uniref:Serine aminopeptidase S33 domain-containing protein n=1 Tax=Salix purpurea TaxID=77065 RepID=A0A9Q0WA60_SALPP|nr:hypothetical protein OIU79_023578 [Salix purpurea]